MRSMKRLLYAICSMGLTLAWCGKPTSAGMTVVSFDNEGPASVNDSGVTPKDHWLIGSGTQDFIPMGNGPYSESTGGDISPMQPDVANEYLVIYLSAINADGEPAMVTGHELTQVSTDQEYVTEIFSSVASTPNVANFPVQLSNDAILPYITSSLPNFPGETTTSGTPSPSKPAPVPEPGAVAYLGFGLAGLLLKRRINRRGKVA